MARGSGRDTGYPRTVGCGDGMRVGSIKRLDCLVSYCDKQIEYYQRMADAAKKDMDNARTKGKRAAAKRRYNEYLVRIAEYRTMKEVR